jgi:hypothetical protein
MGEMKTYSMNDAVYYKLTPKGKEIWEKENEEWRKIFPGLSWSIRYIDKEWVRDTLWCCFERFGKYATAGGDVHITDITFDNPLEKEAADA